MPWSPVHVASGSYGDDDGLGRNPWTDATGHSSSLVADPDSQFSSAKDSIRQRRTLRHIRSQTTTGDPLCSPSDLSDGSQDGRERRGGSLDLHETRPSLKRAINTSRKTFDTARPVNDGGRTRQCENSAAQAEEEVIVHQARPHHSIVDCHFPHPNPNRFNLATRSRVSPSSIMSRWQRSETQISYGRTIPSTSDRCSTSPHRLLPPARQTPCHTSPEDAQNIRLTRTTLLPRFKREHSHVGAMIQQHRILFPQEARRPPSNAFRFPNSRSSHHHLLLPCHHHPSQNHWRSHQSRIMLAFHPPPRLIISQYEARRRLDWQTC